MFARTFTFTAVLPVFIALCTGLVINIAFNDDVQRAGTCKETIENITTRDECPSGQYIDVRVTSKATYTMCRCEPINNITVITSNGGLLKDPQKDELLPPPAPVPTDDRREEPVEL